MMRMAGVAELREEVFAVFSSLHGALSHVLLPLPDQPPMISFRPSIT